MSRPKRFKSVKEMMKHWSRELLHREWVRNKPKKAIEHIQPNDFVRDFCNRSK